MNIHHHTRNDSSLPLGKILIATTITIIIIALGIYWFTSLEAGKKASALLTLAKDDFRLNHLELALDKANQALRLTETPDALELKANILINQGKVYEAEEVLKKLITLSPNNPHYHYLAATMALNEEEYPKAIEYLHQAINIEPDNAHYTVAIANLHYQNGDAEKAKNLFEQLIQKDPKYKEAWNQYATQLINAGQYNEALTIINRALKEFPNDSDFYFMLATTYDFLKQSSNAAKAYYHSLELEPMRDSIAARRYHDITGKHVPLAFEQMERDQISFETQGNVMFIEAEVNHHRGRFLLDTGASNCVLFNNTASQYGVFPSKLKVAIETAGGTIQVPLTTADVQIGRSTINDITFGIIPHPKHLPADGIIGMNFLQKFRMEVDKNAHTITLTH